MTTATLTRIHTPTDYLVTRLLTDAEFAQLRAEAFAQMPLAGTSIVDTLNPDADSPVHCLDTARGGPALTAYFGGTTTLAALERLTGRRWQWKHRSEYGLYNYYREPFHFCGLHRDTDSSELTVVTCIHHDPGPGGEFVLFPDRAGDTLAAIRANPDRGAVTLRLAPGESLIFSGRTVPHAVTPVAPGCVRITAPACYLACEETS